MFKPCERFVKTRPYGRIAFACVQETRHRFHHDLAALEAQALDGLDLVIQQLDRSLESISYQDVELAAMVVADDARIDGRYLEVHQESCPCWPGRRRWPATCAHRRGAAAWD